MSPVGPQVVGHIPMPTGLPASSSHKSQHGAHSIHISLICLHFPHLFTHRSSAGISPIAPSTQPASTTPDRARSIHISYICLHFPQIGLYELGRNRKVCCMSNSPLEAITRDNFDEVSERLARGDTWAEITTRFKLDPKRSNIERLENYYCEERTRRSSSWRIAAILWVLDHAEQIAAMRNRGYDWAAVVGLLPPVCPDDGHHPYGTPIPEHLTTFIREYNDMVDRGIVVVPGQHPRKAPESDEELLVRWIARTRVCTFSTTEAGRCNGRRFTRASRVEAALDKLVERGYIRRIPLSQFATGQQRSSRWEVVGVGSA